MICPNCSTENAPTSPQCVRCGAALTSDARPVPEVPPLALPSDSDAAPPGAYGASPSAALPGPPPMPSPPPGYGGGQMPTGYPPQYGPPFPGTYPAPYPPTPNVIDSIIPTHNPKALTGYYLAVFSVIPLLGIFLGIGGFVLGILGLKEANRNPAIKGKAHAWVAILVGGFFGFGYLILIGGGIIAAILASSR